MFLNLRWPEKSFTLSGPKAAYPSWPGIVADSKRHCPVSTYSLDELLTGNKVDRQAKDSISMAKESKISMVLKRKWWDFSITWKQMKIHACSRRRLAQKIHGLPDSCCRTETFTWQQAIQLEPCTELQFLLTNICSGAKIKRMRQIYDIYYDWKPHAHTLNNNFTCHLKPQP